MVTGTLPGTVLVVDDEPTNAQLLAKVLRRQGYFVQTASDGEKALATVAMSRPDVILLDVVLPGLDGFEVCRRLKADPGTRLIPVIFLTGLAASEHRIKAINAGGDEFLTKPFNLEELEARVRSLLKLKRHTDELESAESVIVSLALTIEARDPSTHGHCHRLSVYATALGEEIGVSQDELAALRRGAYLHDVGKVGIPDSVLLKPAPLTRNERLLMETHTTIGDTLCGDMRSLAALRPIIRWHHERLDGSGYPDGLTNGKIPLIAQIVGIVDSFDAMTTARVYRPAGSITDACAALSAETARGRFDANIVKPFIRLAASGALAGLASAVVPLRAI